MISLNTPVTLAALADVATRAWSWWSGELIDMIPATWRHRLIRPRPQLRLYLDERRAILGQVVEGGAPRLSEVDLAVESPASLGDARGIIEQFEKPRLWLVLAPSIALRREMELPPTAEPRLRDIVRLDLDRQTPFTSEAAAFDVEVRERLPESGRIRVALALVRRETIESALSFCQRLGIAPDRIAIGHPPGSVQERQPEFNFLEGYSPKGRLRLRAHPRLLASALISLLIALNIGLAFSRLDAQADILSGMLAKARTEAQATEKLRAELTRNQSEARLLAEAHGKPGALETINTLTRALPDDVWLFNFDLTGQTAHIAGFAPSAADLIGRLDKAELFANPRFKAPVTRAERAGDDRFEISFELRDGTR